MYRDRQNPFSQVACISAWRCLGDAKQNKKLFTCSLYLPEIKQAHTLCWFMANGIWLQVGSSISFGFMTMTQSSPPFPSAYKQPLKSPSSAYTPPTGSVLVPLSLLTMSLHVFQFIAAVFTIPRSQRRFFSAQASSQDWPFLARKYGSGSKQIYFLCVWLVFTCGLAHSSIIFLCFFSLLPILTHSMWWNPFNAPTLKEGEPVFFMGRQGVNLDRNH